MAKRNDARYAPGELDRVRRNLGPLTQDESSRMAEILGGEIGSESWDPAIEAGYTRLRSRVYSRNQPPRGERPAPRRPVDEAARFPDLGAGFGESEDGGTAVAPRSRAGVVPYAERVRMDLVASRPQHGIKTRRSAISSFFSFLVSVPDFVNPRFILEFDTEVGNHVDTLVLAVRILADKNKKQVYHSLRKDALSFRILNVIRDWNIEALHRELTYLQGRPRRLPIGDCDELARHLYSPMMRLDRLEPLFHVSRAIQFAYQQHVQTLPKSSPEIKRLRKNFMAAQQEVGMVFTGIRRRCYPLLMKLTSTRCLDLFDYFAEERDTILQFLGLEESELLRARMEADTPILEALPETPIDAADSETDPEDAEFDDEEESEDRPEPAEAGRRTYGAVYKGLVLLDRLFPDSGWLKLDTHPDFYAYFQPLLGLPRGFELLPPADVLSPVVVLIAVLGELFYAYGDINFGALRDEDGHQLNLDEIIEELLDSWHRYLDDIIGAEYVTRIVEYCRHVERHADFRSSKYAKRIEAEMAWIKAKHVIRWGRLLSARGLRIPSSKALPALYDRVAELKDFLTRVALDIDAARSEQRPCSTIENPWAAPVFPVASTVSHRFTTVLGRGEPKRDCTNADVIYATVSILFVLSYLLDDDSNPYAVIDTSFAPYRGVDGRGGQPAYVVDLRPTLEVLSAYESEEAEGKEDVATLVSRDDVTGLRNTMSLREELRRMIARYDEDKKPFTLLGAAIRNLPSSEGTDAAAEPLLEAFAACLTESVDEAKAPSFRLDDDSFLILLSGVEEEQAVDVAKRLFGLCLRRDPTNLQLSLAVVPFYRTWGPERVMKSVSRALALAGAHPYPTCLIHKPARSSYEILDLLDDAESE